MTLKAHIRLLFAAACIAGLSGCAGKAGGPIPTDVAGLQLMADRGNPIAANNLGVLYANGKNVPQDFAEAKKWFLFASEHGNPAGEFNLGFAYQHGQGTAVDVPEAIKWFHMAADHNLPAAKLTLSVLYHTGAGVPKDDIEAVRLARSAAVEGFPMAQAYLGALYLDGAGVPADDSLAYEWASIGASKIPPPLGLMANAMRDNAAKGLSPTELTEAQAAAAIWKPGTDLVSLFPPNSGPRPARLRGSGSGFVVGKGGEIATDYHVVPNCREIKLIDPSGKFNKTAHTVAEDQPNDLAVISGGEAGARLKLSSTPAVLGESITSYGFPLGPVLSSSGNMTTGTVSSTTGMQGNAKELQITAPVQAGSSGGPVVDEGGAVVGIVASKLNALALAAATGDLAQNVNFAWQVAQLKTLLDKQGIAYDQGGKAPPKSGVDLAGILQKAAVRIECWR